MGKYEIDRERALARYAQRQLDQRIEALEKFERRGQLSDRKLLISAYEEEIQMTMRSDPLRALSRAVWLLGDCLDRIDPERATLEQLSELYDRIGGVMEVLMWRDEWIGEFRALKDYLERFKATPHR